MGLLRIYSLTILILQLYGAHGENLPELQGNELLVGSARHETAYPLYQACSEKGQPPPQFVFKNTGSFKPSQVLTESIFRNTPFTNAVVVGALANGGVGKFGFSKVQHKTGIMGMGTTMSVYVLTVDPKGEYAYWLPQGGCINIPRTPTGAQPKYVFTPAFSGCSWTVTPLCRLCNPDPTCMEMSGTADSDPDGMLRLRHVTGNKEVPEFNSKTLAQKGGPRSYAMQYKDYGYIRLKNQTFENALAFAYMHFSNGAWSLHTQQKTCAPLRAHPTFKEGKLESIKMTYSNKDNYDMISGGKVFRIP